MGRETTIHRMYVYDRGVDEGQKRIHISKRFIDRIAKKYNIDIPPLKFSKDGLLLYSGKYRNFDIIYDIDKLVIIILCIARRYKRKIAGYFNYTDDQTGGASTGTVLFLDDNSAVINEFNVDEPHTSANFQDALEQKIITLTSSKKYDNLTVLELKKIVKDKGIKGYSKMKKDELLKVL